MRVRDVIKHPPQEGKYEALKNQLLRTCSLSKKIRASKVIDYPAIGDGSYTKIADDFVGWLEGDANNMVVRELFLRHLLENIRAILDEDESSCLRELAKRAD